MKKFSVKWNIKEIKQDKPVNVFSTFSCGGGSTLGYKRAGFRVIGNVEIDPAMNDIYVKNNKPEYNYLEDLRDFNKRQDLPKELYKLDILDGSPPCTSFSTAGIREEGWGKKKKFREGQKIQTLDDLFFVFLETVEKLKPKIVVAENVPGIIAGKAKGYANEIIKRFRKLGYAVQIFALNAAYMDVPQARHRVFFIANNQDYKKLKLNFKKPVIKFGEVRTEEGVEISDGVMKSLLLEAKKGETDIGKVAKRLTGETNKYFTQMIIQDDQVAPTIASGGSYYREADRKRLTDEDFRIIQTFPQDYNFKKNNVQYVCGMSVPPNMMANIAEEIWEQWLE